MDRIPVTVDGATALKEELDYRKGDLRSKIVTAIAEAREHGDLKENAEYAAAREEQAFNEGRILELEGKISHMQVIDVTKMDNTGRVIFGTTVHLVNCDTDEEVVYKIVGDDEADIKDGKISVSSPIARALVGKHTDDEVEVVAPGGIITYAINKVEYI